MILYLISVIWNICLNGLLKFCFAPLFWWGGEIIGFFRSLSMLILVLLLTYWRFQEVLALGVKFLFHSMWGCLLCLILLLNQLKNLFQGLVVEILYFLGFLREMVLSKFFFGLFFLYILIDVVCIQAFCFDIFNGLICNVNLICFLRRWCGIYGCSVIILKKF